MKRMIPFLALAILFACSSNKVPSWVLHPDKQPKDMFFTVGSGDTEIEALCLSLADLAQRLHADIDSSIQSRASTSGKSRSLL
ncbi:MAG TPA: hypothetical protein ENN73_00880 [Firmicutes bacterium]|nr:hypothetical protein [Bacillota bacterium]